VSQASTAATTGVLLVLRVQVTVTALVVHPVVCIPQLRVLQGPMQVERQHANHVVPVNIRQPPGEPIVMFAVLANIQQTPEEQPIAIKVALLVRTSVIQPLQRNTIKKTIVPFAVLVNIH